MIYKVPPPPLRSNPGSATDTIIYQAVFGCAFQNNVIIFAGKKKKYNLKEYVYSKDLFTGVLGTC